MLVTGFFQLEPVAGEIHQLFHVHSLLTFLWKLVLSLNSVFMYCHRVKNPKFHDVCVLGSNTLIFALRGPDFKISAGGHAPGPR